MKLSQDQELRRQRGIQAKDFLQGEFFQKFLLPYLDNDRLDAYPDPSIENWENKYRLAWAKDEVYSKFLSTIKSWITESDELGKVAQEEEKDAITA